MEKLIIMLAAATFMFGFTIAKWLTWCKSSNHSLKDWLDCETRVSEDVFALAWVLGVWRVEETGEIVEVN